MLKLWKVYFNYGDRDLESDVFVHGDDPRPSTEDARKYLLRAYGSDYMQDARENPDLLKVDSVYELETPTDIDGNPYQVIVKE